jgi:hypothetical protein
VTTSTLACPCRCPPWAFDHPQKPVATVMCRKHADSRCALLLAFSRGQARGRRAVTYGHGRNGPRER